MLMSSMKAARTYSSSHFPAQTQHVAAPDGIHSCGVGEFLTLPLVEPKLGIQDAHFGGRLSILQTSSGARDVEYCIR